MKVAIKDFGVDMQIKNKGIELEVKDPQAKHLGDLVITGTKLIWCQGRTSREKGKSISWGQVH